MNHTNMRGVVAVVADGHYYASHQETDMRPGGHIGNLLAEAADIARAGEWDDIVDGWVSKTWVDHTDDNLPRWLRNTVTHPDGDVARRSDWSRGMIPRLSAAETLTRFGSPGLVNTIFDTGTAPSGTHDDLPPFGAPSWRRAAEMPTMLKDTLRCCGRSWAIVVDVDLQRVVCFDYRTGRPVCSADMFDADGLNDLAELACNDPETFTSRCDDMEWAPDHRHVDLYEPDGIELRDGQCARPAGFPPLPYMMGRHPVTAQRVAAGIGF